ncbi:MAG: macro domain-containing protein [Planctomycetes bacterium]|nr:macro domain-containing protein [Planctomycetota bacterium]
MTDSQKLARARFGAAALELAMCDITRETTDAIVNAANEGLAGGGGVDGAIHRAGGPEIMAECRRIGGCQTGKVVATTAGQMAAKRVLHAVGPIWRGGGHGEPELLASCYREALALAEREGLASVSFPSISTGAYAYPVEAAARVAIKTVAEHLQTSTAIKLVRFVLLGRSFGVYSAALTELAADTGCETTE